MMDLSGVWYRIYTEVPFTFLCGAAIVAIDAICIRKKRKIGKKVSLDNKLSCLLGVVAVVWSFVLLAQYMSSISAPDIKKANCIFVESYRDSTQAPPLPYTYGYVFREIGQSKGVIVYLDTFSAEKIIQEELVEGKIYNVWYLETGNIIVYMSPK